MISSASSWILDSASSAHLCTSLQDLEDSRRLRNGKIILCIENGVKVITVAMGMYLLGLPSENILLLSDCYFMKKIYGSAVHAILKFLYSRNE